MKTTTVVITQALRERMPNQVNLGMATLDRLRSAKIPVIGTLWPTGVEHGSLSIREADEDGDIVYEWTPGTPKSKPFEDDDL